MRSFKRVRTALLYSATRELYICGIAVPKMYTFIFNILVLLS